MIKLFSKLAFVRVLLNSCLITCFNLVLFVIFWFLWTYSIFVFHMQDEALSNSSVALCHLVNSLVSTYFFELCHKLSNSCRSCNSSVTERPLL